MVHADSTLFITQSPEMVETAIDIEEKTNLLGRPCTVYSGRGSASVLWEWYTQAGGILESLLDRIDHVVPPRCRLLARTYYGVTHTPFSAVWESVHMTNDIC